MARNIDEQVAKALACQHNKSFGNTQVITENDSHKANSTYVALHGNEIAHYLLDGSTQKARLYVNNCGYPTNATHARLNAIFAELGIHATIKRQNGESVLLDKQGNVLAQGKELTHTFKLGE